MNKKELRERIGDLAYGVTQNAAAERPFTGEYDNFFEIDEAGCGEFKELVR